MGKELTTLVMVFLILIDLSVIPSFSKLLEKFYFITENFFLEVMKDVNRLKAIIFHAEPKLAHFAYNYSHFNMLR